MIEARCNGQEVLQKVERYKFKPTTTITHFDIVTSLHYLLKDPRINIEFKHVLGHKDRLSKDLLILEYLNTIADAKAKVAL